MFPSPSHSDKPDGLLESEGVAAPACVRMQRVVFAGLKRAASFLDVSPWWCVALLLVSLLPYVVLKAHAALLTGDEVYTLRIARAPSLAAMLALSRRIDLHPPLHYLLQRAALATGCPVWLASRLPSLAASVVMVLAVFWFVRRQRGNLWGLVAGSVLLLTPAVEYAWVNRPYALWLGLLALCAVAWQACCAGSRRWWAPVILSLLCCLMCLDYMGGLVCLLVFLAAETLRAWQRRRIDWPVLVGLLIPCVGGGLYLHQVHSFAGNSFAPVYLPTFDRFVDLYGGLLTQVVVIITACLVTWVVLGGQVAEKPVVPKIDVVLGLGLVLLPGFIFALTVLRQSQFFPRYGACGSIGVAMLVPALLLRFVRGAREIAVLVVVATVSLMAVQCANANFVVTGVWRSHRAMGMRADALRLDTLDASVPIVMANAVDYTEANERESTATLAHTFYVYDRASAVAYSGSTVFETEDETAKLLGFSSKTEALAPFLAEHPRFYLVADYLHPEEWVMRKMLADGARVEFVGKFASTYTDDDLWLVTVKP